MGCLTFTCSSWSREICGIPSHPLIRGRKKSETWNLAGCGRNDQSWRDGFFWSLEMRGSEHRTSPHNMPDSMPPALFLCDLLAALAAYVLPFLPQTQSCRGRPPANHTRETETPGCGMIKPGLKLLFTTTQTFRRGSFSPGTHFSQDGTQN